MTRYVLGARVFPSKAAATAAIGRVLNATPPDAALAGDDLALVADLLHHGRHPEAAAKIGTGIAGIVVRAAGGPWSGPHQRCFWVQRTDGTEIDFSYRTALNGAKSPKRAAVEVLREEIREQISAFRLAAQQRQQPCGLCGQSVQEVGHVDHADPTFDELAARFAEAVGGWNALEIECVGPTGRQLRNRELGVVWHRYHAHAATLRLTHSACNLGRKRGAA